MRTVCCAAPQPARLCAAAAARCCTPPTYYAADSAYIAVAARLCFFPAALVLRVWPGSEWELRSPTKNLDDGQVAAFVS